MLVTNSPFAVPEPNERYSSPSNEVKELQSVTSREQGNWLPIPVPVSNPTVGTGLKFVLLYLHPEEVNSTNTQKVTSGLGVMWTDSESKALGVFHDNNFFEDRLRFKSFLGTVNLNLDYFGKGGRFKEAPLQYNMVSNSALVELLGNLPRSENWYIGLRWLWVDAALDFRINNEDLVPELSDLVDLNFESTTSSLGLVLSYDTRDDKYYPTAGQWFNLTISEDDESWSSDYDFSKSLLDYRAYFSINERNVFATKVTLSDVSGRAPFYMQSSLSVRGNSHGRYLDDSSASIHLEWRYKFKPRWGLVGFLESGRVAGAISDLSQSESVNSIGAGIRWQPLAEETLNIGVDFAVSNDEKAAYIRVTESF